MEIPAAKFLSSLVKSLQVLCNGHLDFDASIELVGHINIKIDKNLKFNCILDEQVSKQANDSTTFCSNSYHSLPPRGRKAVDLMGHAETDAILPGLLDTPSLSNPETSPTILESVERRRDRPSVPPVVNSKPSVMHGNPSIIKVEDEDSGEGFSNMPSTSDPALTSSMMDTGPSAQDNDCLSPAVHHVEFSAKTKVTTLQESVDNPCEDGEVKNETAQTLPNHMETLNGMKTLISKMTKACDMIMVQSLGSGNKHGGPVKMMSEEELVLTKKKILQTIEKTHLKKLKDILHTKKGLQRKQELKTLIGEIGLTNDQLLLLAYDLPRYQNKGNLKGGTQSVCRGLKDSQKFRRRTQERQERLLVMAEMLKKNISPDPGMTVISKSGSKKCTLLKSGISFLSHNSEQLSMDNIDDAVDLLTASKRSSLLQKRTDIKGSDLLKSDIHKKHVVKRKMKQIASKMMDEIVDSGYRVVFSTTVGSDLESQTAELSVIPLNVDDLFPENRDADFKSEMTEEEYAKHLEREHFVEKQKNNAEKMRDWEDKLTRILSGAEEIYVPSRKRYAPGESRPTDAERMKAYRKKLKSDPEKYQVYKQKRAINKKRRRLGALAAKLKGAANNSSVLSGKAEEPPHVSQPMGNLVTMSQPVEIHCPQVYGHPSSHQPPAVVSVHQSSQFVGQVSGMHTNHQQPITYDNEMDFVELIAATHNVQNQHFG